MPNATVTIRELKNKNTGIDVSIPTHKEIPGLLGATIEYQVVVVTILQCFKLPKHKETDVVQFMIPKHIDDFEEFRKKLSVKFPGTLFPPLPKKTFGILDSNVKDRVTILETFMKFVVGSLKTAASPIVIQFLGASPLKAGVSRANEKGAASDSLDLFEEDRLTKDLASPTGNLFGEPDEEDLELFAPSEMKTSTSGGALFRDSTTTTPVEQPKNVVKLFADQDLGGAVSRDEVSSLFLVPDTAEPEEKKPEVALEDNSDLLNIEDDLDDLFRETTITKKPQPTIAKKTNPQDTPKPSVPSKPQIATKPQTAPKPQMAPKPQTAPKPQAAPKPQTAPKPKAAPKPSKMVAKPEGEEDDLFSTEGAEKGIAKLDATDIMKYIESSTTDADADLDLFS